MSSSPAFCILGTYVGLDIDDAIANTRAVGAVLGVTGWPLVGFLVGLTGGLHRYTLGVHRSRLRHLHHLRRLAGGAGALAADAGRQGSMTSLPQGRLLYHLSWPRSCRW